MSLTGSRATVSWSERQQPFFGVGVTSAPPYVIGWVSSIFSALGLVALADVAAALARVLLQNEKRQKKRPIAKLE